MAIQRITADDIVDQTPTRTLLDEGWYQLAITKTEMASTKATQDMLKYQARACAKENDPNSVQGGVLFGQVLFPSWEDDDEFQNSIMEKKGIDGEELEQAVRDRKAQATRQVSQFGLAVFGYDSFPAVPRKDPERGGYYMPDGTEVADYEARRDMFKARDAEAFNAVADVAEGETDITRYLVYAKVVKSVYRGQEKNEIKTIRATLPDGEDLSFPG